MDSRPEGAFVVQIRELIRASGRSLRDLEKASGVSRGQLSRFLNGKRDLTLTTVGPLLEALGLEIRLKKQRKK
jgi:transcriptional regulator with XRE-family HTH domain